MDVASVFWTETERYHDLAKKFEENIEITSPSRLSGRSGEFSFCGCSRCAQVVTYYEYRGEAL